MITINTQTVNRILSDTCYVRTAGTNEELQCARYIVALCKEMGFAARLEPFSVRMYEDECASLTINGKSVECKALCGSGNGDVKAELYHLTGTDKVSLENCKGKIVLSDKPVGYKLYDMLCEHGAKAYITYNGSIRHDNKDIDRRTIGFETCSKRLPCVNIHIGDAFDTVKNGCGTAELSVKQKEYIGTSYNVILDIDGETDETVVISAHYDSTSLSVGAFDNMTGCIGLLYLVEYFASQKKAPKRNIRFLWCGSEEVGLVGSRAYCRAHASELEKTSLNINLDMLGCVMGGFNAFSCIDETMTDFMKTFCEERGFAATVNYGIRSSDSNSFLECGVPAVSFARYGAGDTGIVHTRYDTAECVSAAGLLGDMVFIAEFTAHAANAPNFPPSRAISEKIQKEIADYMTRKRDLP